LAEAVTAEELEPEALPSLLLLPAALPVKEPEELRVLL
jgi:hypothetical protein